MYVKTPSERRRRTDFYLKNGSMAPFQPTWGSLHPVSNTDPFYLSSLEEKKNKPSLFKRIKMKLQKLFKV